MCIYSFRNEAVDSEKLLPLLELKNKKLRIGEANIDRKVKSLKTFYLKSIQTGKLIFSD